MQIAVIGTGYVGLVSGACLADAGHSVTCIDKDTGKIAGLQAGSIPIYEPGLEQLVTGSMLREKLRFTADLPAGIADAEAVFLAVGTPQAADGAADLSGIWAAGAATAAAMTHPKTIVIKSTVPVGTNAELARRMATLTDVPFDVASNPEFLKEGSALGDFTKPDRVVIGVRRPEAATLLEAIYEPVLRGTRPFLVMSPESAEMTKYVANCMLATKISFINEMANVCGSHGADIDDVRAGIGHDRRIGFDFLKPGPGYGGSCFPKDIRAAIHMAASAGCPARLLTAVDAVNEEQKQRFADRVAAHLGVPVNKQIVAVLGLAFKANTDDIRESPALVLIDTLLSAGARLRVTDPEAMPNVRELYGDQLDYFADPYQAAQGADIVAIVTDWQDYRRLDYRRLRDGMRGHSIFDGRNVLDPREAVVEGFAYFGVGRDVKALRAATRAADARTSSPSRSAARDEPERDVRFAFVGGCRIREAFGTPRAS